jgi:CheY-like chemotaxis protein
LRSYAICRYSYIPVFGPCHRFGLRGGGFSAPIVAVTAYAMSNDREECLRLGCDDFVSKPIEWDRFFAKLTWLLSRTSGG